MRKFKLIAADLDGTLLDDTYNVKPELLKYINLASEKGVQLLVATGRLYPSALPFVKDLSVTLPVIASNGAVVKEPENGKIIYHFPLERQLVRDVLKITKDYPVQRFININDTFYTDAPEENTKKYSEALKVEFVHIEPLEKVLDNDEPTMAVVRGKDELIKELTGIMHDYFGEKVYLANSKPFFIDVNNPSVSKGAALARLCTDLKINPAEVISIGDGWNDLEMFKVSGLGVAVANAPGKLKNEADYVCENSTYHGVIEVIKQFVL